MKLVRFSSLSAIALSLALVRCSPPTPSADAGDAAANDAAVTDARDAAVASRAGLECADDTACNGLTCDTTVAGGACTGECMNGTPASEAMQCGGTGSTCLTADDGAAAESFCTRRCTTGTMNSGCRAGFVCTGFWATHAGGTPDSAGCVPFCATDAQCPTGQRCNARTGECSMTGANPTGLADGVPCRIPAMNQPDPCRGTCFLVVTGNPMGVCGSSIDLSRTQSCPDDPMNIEPLAPQTGDNLAFCIFRNCSATECCGAGLVCEGEAETGACSVDDPMVPNIACAPGDGGAPADASVPDARPPTDAAVDAAVDASVDAARADVATGG
jgi:Cys-rich repeat protein